MGVTIGLLSGLNAKNERSVFTSVQTSSFGFLAGQGENSGKNAATACALHKRRMALKMTNRKPKLFDH